MSNLDVLVEPVKREIAVPGEFATVFPSTSDDDLLATLGDSFAEAQLDGFFSTNVLDPDTSEVTPDLSAAGGALVVIYAGGRIIRSRLRQLTSGERYVAGPVEYEIQRAAGVLREDLLALERRKAQLIQRGRRQGGTAYVYDGYFARAATDWAEVGSFYPLELAG